MRKLVITLGGMHTKYETDQQGEMGRDHTCMRPISVTVIEPTPGAPTQLSITVADELCFQATTAPTQIDDGAPEHVAGLSACIHAALGMMKRQGEFMAEHSEKHFREALGLICPPFDEDDGPETAADIARNLANLFRIPTDDGTIH